MNKWSVKKKKIRRTATAPMQAVQEKACAVNALHTIERVMSFQHAFFQKKLKEATTEGIIAPRLARIVEEKAQEILRGLN